MSENSTRREHMQPVFLSAVHYVGVSKMMAKLECSKSAAMLYLLNEGLYKEGLISQQDHDLLAKRYGRKLVDVQAEAQIKKESSHMPVLTIEQLKEKAILEQKDKQFKGQFEQWEIHPDPIWRAKGLSAAEAWKDKLDSARLLLKKRAPK